MTPKEKAEDLVNKFHNSAIQVVNEIIKSRKDDIVFDDTKLGIVTYHITPHPMYLSYWLKVKEEINKI